MALRLVLEPSSSTAPLPEDEEQVLDDGILVEDLTIVVYDANGQGTRIIPAGQAPGTITVTVPLTDSRATRYPVDRYRATVVVVAQRDGDPERAVPIRLSLRSNDPVFSVQLDDDRSSAEAGVVDLRIAAAGR